MWVEKLWCKNLCRPLSLSKNSVETAPFSLLPRFHTLQFPALSWWQVTSHGFRYRLLVARAPNTHADPCSVSSGCTLFFYESDGRSGIDHNSIPKHAVWVENSIVQAVPEHPKKDFVFCLSNSLGDAFLFQVCWACPWWAFYISDTDRFLSRLYTPPCFPFSGRFYLLLLIETKMMQDKINTYTECQE